MIDASPIVLTGTRQTGVWGAASNGSDVMLGMERASLGLAFTHIGADGGLLGSSAEVLDTGGAVLASTGFEIASFAVAGDGAGTALVVDSEFDPAPPYGSYRTRGRLVTNATVDAGSDAATIDAAAEGGGSLPDAAADSGGGSLPDAASPADASLASDAASPADAARVPDASGSHGSMGGSDSGSCALGPARGSRSGRAAWALLVALALTFARRRRVRE